MQNNCPTIVLVRPSVGAVARILLEKRLSVLERVFLLPEGPGEEKYERQIITTLLRLPAGQQMRFCSFVDLIEKSSESQLDDARIDMVQSAWQAVYRMTQAR